MRDEERLPINESQARGLVAKLPSAGLYLNRSGNSYIYDWIEVKEKKENHPMIDGTTPCNVGFLAGDKALFLDHIDRKFPEDYHGKLRKLYQELTGAKK